MSIQKKTSQRQGFKTGESIVYPAHGVGQIVAIEERLAEVEGWERRVKELAKALSVQEQ